MNDSFLFYRSWIENIEEEYSDPETRQSLVYAIVKYGITGKKTYPAERMFLKQCYSNIDAMIAKHNKAVESGRKGGLAKGSLKGASRVYEANENKNSNINENTNSNDNSNENNDFCSGSPSYEGTVTEKDEFVSKEDGYYVNGVRV